MPETYVASEGFVTKLAKAVQRIVYDYQGQTGIIPLGALEEEVKILILPLLSSALRANEERVRQETLEEAAKAAEHWAEGSQSKSCQHHSTQIAAAIRALAARPAGAPREKEGV